MKWYQTSKLKEVSFCNNIYLCTFKNCWDRGSKVHCSSWQWPEPISWNFNWVVTSFMVCKHLYDNNSWSYVTLCNHLQHGCLTLWLATKSNLCVWRDTHCIFWLWIFYQHPKNDRRIEVTSYLINLEICSIEWEAPPHCCSAWYLCEGSK